jgi:hypothetical protein
MNAFVSHATHSSEQYIVSLVAKKLADNQIGAVTNFVHTEGIDLQTSAQIRKATIFIGLVTNAGTTYRKNQVFTEFQFALQNQRPSILLVEQGTRIPAWLDQSKIIVFSRYNIDGALQIANHHIDLAKATQQGKENAAWLLGGVAILALLALLANDKK